MRMNREKGVALITSLMVLIMVSAIIAGMCWMVMTDQRLGGNNQDRETAFYAAEAGMEKLTADVGSTFSVKGSLSSSDITTIMSAPPTTIPGVQFVDSLGNSSYLVSPLVPVSSNATILPPSPYAGMQGLITPFTLTVGARTPDGAEVKLEREVQVVAIPVFQFGVYSDSDVAYFNGPTFQFGGRVHTNGNLWLSPNSGPLYLGDKVTAVGQVIRTNLENGYAVNGSNYTGNVTIALSSNPNLTNEPTGSPYTNSHWRELLTTEGSVTGTSVYGNVSTHLNPIWPGGIDGTQGQYNGQLETQVPTLSLTSTALSGITTPISLIRRAIPGENVSNPSEFAEQYFSEATLRILLDDYPTGVTPGSSGACHNADMMSLPTVTTGTDPVDLSTLAFPSATWTSATPPSWYTGTSNVPSGALFPLPVSGAASNTAFTSTDGYWLKNAATTKPYPTILGCIKIEYQTTGGGWVDYTQQILNLGFTGRDIAPTGSYTGSDGATAIAYTNPGTDKLPTLPTSSAVGFPAQGPSAAGTAPATIPAGCTDPSPNAIIRIARVRDNPSYMTTGKCLIAISKTNFNATDFWPLALYDTREGTFRQVNTTPGVVSADGVMYYIELDATNLATWLKNNQLSLGLNNNTGFTVYFSDRRGEQPDPNAGLTKTGSYGFNDFVNSPDVTNGCPNGTLDPAPGQGEDLEGDGILRTYGGVENPPAPTADILPGLWNASGYMNNTVLASNTACGTHPNRPDVTYVNAQYARENSPVFFRRALKIVDGETLNLGTSCGAVACGLTIAAENPVYIQGDYNAPPGGAFTGGVATAVAGDAVTFLSDNWNDANSFVFPQHIVSGKIRNAVSTAYRVAIVSGKGIPFVEPAGTAQDYGTDGGLHNFLRFLEGWGGTVYYRGSLVSFFYSAQGIGPYKCCTTVYSAPNREYTFDENFTLGPQWLPPRTPTLRSINTVGFTQQILPTQ